MEMALCYWFNANDCGVPWSSSRVDDMVLMCDFLCGAMMMCVESRVGVSPTYDSQGRRGRGRQIPRVKNRAF